MSINRKVVAAWLIMVALGMVTGADAGPLAKVCIVPREVGLVVGVKQQFKVVGEDADGNEVPISGAVTWSTTAPGCFISSSGLFTAGANAGKYMTSVNASVAGGLVGTASAEIYPNVSQNGYIIERSIGGVNIGAFDTPLDVAVDAGGNIYIVSRDSSVIQKFNPASGQFRQFKLSSAIGTSAALAVDSAGNVYVLDRSNYRVSKYNSSGTLLAQWGSHGTGDGQFSNPSDIAVDGLGNVFVSDWSARLVNVFDSAGSFVRSWRVKVLCAGFGIYDIGWPVAMEIGPNGSLYVATFTVDCDYMINNVNRFDAYGNLLEARHMVGMDVLHDVHIAIGKQDNVYTLYGNKVEEWTEDPANAQRYNWHAMWGDTGSGSGMFLNASGIACDGNGNVYVADTDNSRVQVFDGSGTLLTVYGAAGTGKGQFHCPSSLTTDSQGNVYVGDAGNYRVQVFDSSGTYLRETASKPQKDSAYACSGGLAIGPSGNLYTTDTIMNRLLAFDSGGSLLSNWSLPGTGAAPMGVAYSASGYFYTVDGAGSVVRKLNNAGSVLATWSGPGSTDGLLNTPVGIGVDSKGYIYVADYGNNRIQKFTGGSGTYTTKWGNAGAGNGQFQGPAGLCVSSKDEVFVADTANCRIQRFSSGGGYLSKLGAAGFGAYEFQYPEGVAVDKQGSIYVADTGNSRLVKFNPVGTVTTIRDCRMVADGYLVSLSGAIVSAAYKDFFYIESKDRTCGIRVEMTAHTLTAGKTANISGAIRTNASGERYISAGTATPVGADSVKPLGMLGRAVGGGAWPFISGQQGIKDAAGTSNIGLLIRTFGRVTYSTSGYFYIDDGSALSDGSGHLGIKVIPPSTSVPDQGSYAQVTGASSCYTLDGTVQRLIWATQVLGR